MERDQYPRKWQRRFDFFDQNGAPNTREFRTAINALPFAQRYLYNANFFGFFFDLIYLFILGLWRKALAWLAIIIVSETLGVFLCLFIGELIYYYYAFISLFVVFGITLTTNYAYYLKEIKGTQSWNPLEGIRLF